MKVLITGGEGQLGRAFRDSLEGAALVTALGKEELDVACRTRVYAVIKAEKPDLILHCAALTNVDECERNPKRALTINGHGPAYVAKAAFDVGARFLYISSDYIFHRNEHSPVEIDDLPTPVSVYGASKWIGEQLALKQDPHAYIVRTAWLYGGGKSDFVNKVIGKIKREERLEVVTDQAGSPTYVNDFVTTCLKLLEHESGIYHLTNQGCVSRYELTQAIAELYRYDLKLLSPVRTASTKGVATRPMRTELSLRSLDEKGIERPRYWYEALQQYINEELDDDV